MPALSKRVDYLTYGALFQCGGFWVGVHYSRYNRRFCINLLPCFTFWVALPGGYKP